MTKKIESVRYTDVLTLEVVFSGGEVRILDCTKKVQDWFRKNKKDLIRISENFNTAHEKDGNVAFRCGKESLYISAADVYKNSYPVSEPKKAEKTPKKTAKKTVVKTVVKTKTRDSFVLGSIMSTDVMNVANNGMRLTGIWKDFLGEPEPNFMLVASSQPGMGKSTMMVKLANYLTKFGKPHYFSAEENYARLKRKLKLIGDKIHNFPMNDKCQTLQDIYDVIEKEGMPDFLFIDSLQRFGMEYDDVVAMRKKFPKMAIILICQETKSGKVRGDNRIIHEGDITVQAIKNGHFETKKNRFGELAEIVIFGDDKDDEEDEY